MTDLQLVTRAAHYAAHAHRKHRRKGAEATPYINHLTEVADLLAAADQPAYVIAAGYLHDTIEDVDVTYDMLVAEFGAMVADLVVTVTDDRYSTREARKQRQVERAPLASPETAAIKLADKLSNLRSLLTGPPENWAQDRILQYVNWAHEVVSRLPYRPPMLDVLYDEVRAEALRRFT